MKKTIITIVCIVVTIIAIVFWYYNDYKSKYAEIEQFNLQYEVYLDKEIYGSEVATVINKIIDSNDKNGVEKEYVINDGNKYYFYIPNDENSIKMDIKITDNDTIYPMESLYQGEIIKFVQNYNGIKFKCTKIEYNSAKKVNYMLFEQITQ